jgi:hypothetical protein
LIGPSLIENALDALIRKCRSEESARVLRHHLLV